MASPLPGPCPVCGKTPGIWYHRSIFGESNVCDIECSDLRHSIKLTRDSGEEAVRDWNRLFCEV